MDLTSRPLLPPWLTPRARGDGSIQLGAGDDGGLVLHGLSSDEHALLSLLDGKVSTAELLDRSTALGIARERALELLHRLTEHGALTSRPAHPLGPRRSRIIVADDTGVGRAIADALRQVDGPCVELGTWAEDRAELDARRVERAPDEARHGRRPGTDAEPAPRLVVTVERDPIGGSVGGGDARQLDLGTLALAEAGHDWPSLGVPQLLVRAGRHRFVVGPLLDGDRQSGPCRHCLELQRDDRDPHRPRAPVAASPASLTAPTGLTGLTGLTDESLLRHGASLTCVVALDVLAGHGPPPGVTVEVALPGPRLLHRRWLRHPRCPRHEPAEHHPERRGQHEGSAHR